MAENTEQTEEIAVDETKDPVETEKKKRGGKGRHAAATCYIDTEFNGMDYHGQNGGYQDVVQIGAVIMMRGKVYGEFNSYCRLPRGARASKRLEQLTGITKETLQDAPTYCEALSDFVEFIDMYSPSKIYAYGSEDKVRLLETIKHSCITDRHLIEVAGSVTDILPSIDEILHRTRRTGTLSLNELCDICTVTVMNEHDAFSDAKRLGVCFERMKRGEFSREVYESITENKEYRINYYNKRRFREPIIVGKEITSLESLDAFIDIIEQAKATGKYKVAELDALRDDVLTLAGIAPLYENEGQEGKETP